MDKLSYIKEWQAGELKISERLGAFFLTYGKEDLMNYMPTYPVTLEQLSAEIELANGHCIVTGLGLGLRETCLAEKSEVTKITVIEQYPELIEWYKTEAGNAGVNIDKFEFIVGDADTITGMTCDCLFLDHYFMDNRQDIIKRSKVIAQNNQFKTFWFWPLFEIYAQWLKDTSSLATTESFKLWSESVGMGSLLPEVSTEFLNKNLRKYFGLDLQLTLTFD